MLWLHDRHGFSLIEALISLAILAIGVLAVVNLFPVGMRHARMAQERTIAKELADSRLGRVRMAGARSVFDSVSAGSLQSNTLLTLSSINRIYGAYALYEGYFTTAQRMPGARDTGLQRVTFTVEMADGRRETFVTYVSEI